MESKKQEEDRTVIISLPLMNFRSNSTSVLFKPGQPIPRGKAKVAGEMEVAQAFLSQLARIERVSFNNLRPGEDPPDLKFECDKTTIGLELTEVVPGARYSTDNKIEKLKSEVCTMLTRPGRMKNWVFLLGLKDCYADHPKVPHAEDVAPAIDAFFDRLPDKIEKGPYDIPIPAKLEALLSSISGWPDSVSTDDPRLFSPDHPLVLVDASVQKLEYSKIPAMAQEVIDRKKGMATDDLTWLIIWASHDVFLGPDVRQHLVKALRDNLLTQPKFPFGRVYAYFYPVQPTLERLDGGRA